MASLPKKLCLEHHLSDREPTDTLNLTLQKMYCWGSSVDGELGLGGIEDHHILTPRKINFDKANEVEQIACGENYSIVITECGKIYSCGNNDYHQLGHKQPRKRLQLIPNLDAFVFKKVACGASHTMAVNEWGQLFSWGSNSEGQLGLNSHQLYEESPQMIKTLGTSVVVQVACGREHTLALTNNGEIYSWGSNREGQLGLGTTSVKEIKPKLISSLGSLPIVFIACGGYHSIAVTKSGAVFGWGKNVFGQLGINDVQNRDLPCQLWTLRNAKVCYVACGEEFSVFLTMDGGVFTCGAGTYGQLGHGNKTNEILPRQVMELMGSTVTQISCGRRHTLALVSPHGRVYAWGLGGAGQLGNCIIRSVSTPQTVLGPWVTSDISRIISNESNNDNCTVKHIFSGGDHCFATVQSIKDNARPDDCRILPLTSQIYSITEELLSTCGKISNGAPVDHDLMTYLETVFSSTACVNGSFLYYDDNRFGCSDEYHGVDLEHAAKLFGIISEFSNETIRDLILTGITENILPSLTSSVPDIESLKVYLILPLYHGFSNPSIYNTLHKPFCKAVLNLKPELLKVLQNWWNKATSHYFERLVRVHKAIITELIKDIKKNEHIPSYVDTLHTILKLLRMLSRLNSNVDGYTKVPHATFHVPNLMKYINVRTDYFKWLTVKENESLSHKILFCDYPFIFDIQAKTTLLETDQAIQMQKAMNEATSLAIARILFNPYPTNNMEANIEYVTLHVSRENLVRDTLEELSRYQSNDLKKPLRIKFHGEEAEDAGGVRKEFFMLLLKEILDPKYGMFKQFKETRTVWFSEDTFEDEDMYFLIGVLCGLLIYNFVIINLPFPLALYKKLLREPVELSDLRELAPDIARGLQSILDYKEPDLEEVFCLQFSINKDVFGSTKLYEFIPGGNDIPVTLENKKQYVNLYVDYVLNKSVENHFLAFNKGFHKVSGSRVLQLFHSHELMAVIVGNENYDWEELEKNTTYKNGYFKDDITIVLFWQVFHELTLKQKKNFLLFLTGSDRIPIQGMKAIRIAVQPMTDERYLPVAHTCFNLLDLPRYKTRERLRYKLLQAIQQTHGFSLV